jgi:hypothetical protein
MNFFIIQGHITRDNDLEFICDYKDVGKYSYDVTNENTTIYLIFIKIKA